MVLVLKGIRDRNVTKAHKANKDLVVTLDLKVLQVHRGIKGRWAQPDRMV